MSALPEPIEKLYTSEDLEVLSARGERYELWRGRLEEMPPAGWEHGDATISLSGFANTHALLNRLGRGYGAETGFKIERDPDTVLAPDWAFIRSERLTELRPGGFASIIPDLVLETRSPEVSKREITKKIERWLQAGVRVVWDVDPERRILNVHRSGSPSYSLGPGDTLTEEELLPGFSLPLSYVFPDASQG